MNLISASEARKISEDANIVKYKKELEEIFQLIEDKAHEGKNFINLSENKYVNAVSYNEGSFKEKGYGIHYWSVTMSYTISW